MALHHPPSGKFEPVLVRFRPTDQPGRPRWSVLEVSSGVMGSWLMFVDTKGNQLRRISPVPQGWRLLNAGELTALWERATVAPRVTPHKKRGRRLHANANAVPAPTGTTDEQNLLWERERRIAAETSLEHLARTVEELEQELKYANDDLRAMNEEIQTLVQGLISERNENPEHDPVRAATLDS